MQTAPPYPARLDGRLDEPLNRWLWLVKWLLAIPHWIVLAFLWIAFVVVSVVAFFAILITGRYPRDLFDFNVGVIRWAWRVVFYAFVLGTDRYPPFTLQSDPSYPADFQVPHPERLSRLLVLVKWWLLAIPHYLILAIFGGGIGGGGRRGGADLVIGGGVLGGLALLAGILLAIRTRYPRPIFEVLMGLQRWGHRVLSYSALMRDEYPPFRLDAGGMDPGTAAVGGDSGPLGPPDEPPAPSPPPPAPPPPT